VKFQSNASSCGPASLRNALLCRGIVRSEEELTRLTDFTPASGTSMKGLFKAATAIAAEHPAVTPGVLREQRGDVAVLRLIAALEGGSPVILCVDDFEHYVTAFGLLGKGTVHVADSADEELIRSYSVHALSKRWRGPSKRSPYYGLIL
jgi:hypothetical protein